MDTFFIKLRLDASMFLTFNCLAALLAALLTGNYQLNNLIHEKQSTMTKYIIFIKLIKYVAARANSSLQRTLRSKATTDNQIRGYGEMNLWSRFCRVKMHIDLANEYTVNMRISHVFPLIVTPEFILNA